MPDRVDKVGVSEGAPEGRPLADTCPSARYLVCIARGNTRIVDKYPADDGCGVQAALVEHRRGARSYWIVEQASGRRVAPEELS